MKLIMINEIIVPIIREIIAQFKFLLFLNIKQQETYKINFLWYLLIHLQIKCSLVLK